ncbi:unnamed protein product [Brugia pahangi]|uniref:Pre-mRNA-splicing factor SYF2 n=1 Tax=Brugia pahangi TaxID=6280 RepID=A0A0N4T5K2_BRUPA|nr:unnamed protein product [Brugia pahangi]
MQKKRAEAQRQRSNRFLSALLAANAPFYHSLCPFRMQTCRVICKHDKTCKHKRMCRHKEICMDALNRLMDEPPTSTSFWHRPCIIGNNRGLVVEILYIESVTINRSLISVVRMNRSDYKHCKMISVPEECESCKSKNQKVIEEDPKLPKNYDLKRKRQKWQHKEMELKKAAEERGENYGRLKALKTQVDLIGRKKAIKRKKKPDRGFCDYEAMTLRQYQRMSGNIKPDIKEKWEKLCNGTNEFYPGVDILIYGTHYPTDAS